MLVPNYHQHNSSMSPYHSNNSMFSSSSLLSNSVHNNGSSSRINHECSYNNSFEDNVVEDVLFIDNEEKAAALAVFEA